LVSICTKRLSFRSKSMIISMTSSIIFMIPIMCFALLNCWGLLVRFLIIFNCDSDMYFKFWYRYICQCYNYRVNWDSRLLLF
jgi:hypothetical protein